MIDKLVQVKHSTMIEGLAVERMSEDSDQYFLAVRFKTGAFYYYSFVSEEAVEALVNDQSVGKAFIAHIRNDHPKDNVYSDDMIIQSEYYNEFIGLNAIVLKALNDVLGYKTAGYEVILVSVE